MLVGNLGSTYRVAYGVLGDNVRLGSRLEGLSKEREEMLFVPAWASILEKIPSVSSHPADAPKRKLNIYTDAIEPCKKPAPWVILMARDLDVGSGE